VNLTDALNKLCKWRVALAGRWLGTRLAGDPECIAVRDVFDKLLVLRVEVTAITRMLLEKGICTQAELADAMATEAMALDKMYEQQFPGLSTSLTGLHIKMPEAAETMKGWPA
jgi:hypothetical protein